LVTKFKCLNCGVDFIHPAKLILAEFLASTTQNKTIETHVCPACNDWKLEELVIPEVELEDVISVEYVNVGAKIAEGYKVKEIYAKSCTLIKPKPKEVKP
jgi:hypothetical protein